MTANSGYPMIVRPLSKSLSYFSHLIGVGLYRYCNGTAEEGFEHQDISCPAENQIVYVNLITHTWYCGVVSVLFINQFF